jgi:hypothetical protein
MSYDSILANTNPLSVHKKVTPADRVYFHTGYYTSSTTNGYSIIRRGYER